MILTHTLNNFSSIVHTFAYRSTNACNFLYRSSTTVRSAAVMCLIAAALLAAPARGATISYGNFNVPSAGIMFVDVTESSSTDAVPMFGPPQPYAVGLDFDPTNFGSSSTNGSADITDGQLNFTVMGLVNQNGFVGINSFNLSEFGDFSLTGIGTAATQALAGAIVRVTVTQINGLPVVPFNLTPANASVGFNLVANPGIVQPWSLGIGYNIASQLPQGQSATKVEVAIDNSLLTVSQPGTIAFIAKKGFQIDLTPGTTGQPFVPEPTTLVLSVLASAAVVACWRPRSKA